MELLWIFLLIFNVCAASGNKPDTRPEDCHRECVVFNIPHILCAPDISKVSVTPYYECTTVPKFRNLLSKECLTPLCDFPTERCRKEFCEPQPCKPPKSQVSYQTTDSYIADPADPDGSLGLVGDAEPTLTDETWQGNPQDDDNAPLVEDNTEYMPPGTLNQYLIPPKKPPTYEPPKWPPRPEPPKESPPCVEPPKWPPPPPPPCSEPPNWPSPCPEPPKPPPSCEKPPKWPPPQCSYPPTWPPACCEPPKWPPPCPEPPKDSPPCVEPPKWPSPCLEPPNLPPSCQEPPKWPPSCPYPPNWPPTCCEPSNWPPPPCPEPPTWPPSCCEPPNWPPPCPEPPKPPQKSCKPKECLTPALQNAPTSTVVYPDIGCGCYVNPRYFCELYKLYNQDDDENVSNDPISYSTGQDKYGQKLGPVETSYTGTNPNNRGTIPAGRTMLLYNTNPKDRVWTSSSRDGEYVPAICFDREYINKCCRSCPPPPPPPKPQPQYPPYITQDEPLGNAQQSSPGQVPPQETGAEQPESELKPEDIPNFDINFVPASSIPDFHNSEITYEQLNQDQDETPIDNNPTDTSQLSDDFDNQRK